jgi:hypothetical protein
VKPVVVGATFTALLSHLRGGSIKLHVFSLSSLSFAASSAFVGRYSADHDAVVADQLTRGLIFGEFCKISRRG